MSTSISKPEFIPDPTFTASAILLREMIGNAQQMVAFTGAGVSVESGIPTYRGAGGLWSKYDPDKYASIDFFYRDPSYYWQFFKEIRYPSIINARPNLGHLALAELERQGKISAILTQNIDGLHQEAGSRKVLELHGTTRRYYCLNCGRQYTLEEVRQKVEQKCPVFCEDCSNLVRPATVMFGEALDYDVMESAHSRCSECDLLLVIGSSLQVHPAADYPLIAKRAGALLAIINIDPTPLDSLADFIAHSPASNLLAQAVWFSDSDLSGKP